MIVLFKKALPFSLCCTLTILLLCGCKGTENFEPLWLPKSAHVTYSVQYQGHIIVKLKARATEADFRSAVSALQLISYTEDKEYSQHTNVLGWQKGPNKRWDPSANVDGTLICHHLNLWDVAKYENGFLYYEMVDTEGP